MQFGAEAGLQVPARPRIPSLPACLLAAAAAAAPCPCLPNLQGGGVQVLDVTRMDRPTQRALMERVLKHGEADNLPLVRRVAERLQRWVRCGGCKPLWPCGTGAPKQMSARGHLGARL